MKSLSSYSTKELQVLLRVTLYKYHATDLSKDEEDAKIMLFWVNEIRTAIKEIEEDLKDLPFGYTNIK